MANEEKQFNQASIKTANNLKNVAHSMSNLSRLSLPEVDLIVDRVARVVPAGNVPGVILNGLARLPDRTPPPKTVKRDINLLFKGVNQALDKAVYGAVFAGPAAVIWGYQNLLKLAGKDPNQSFPEGTWQFYADYALREDTARHANESHGFDSDLKRHQIQLSPGDRVTAWVMAAIQCLHQYPALLTNEWRERVYTYLLFELTRNEASAGRYVRLYRDWEKQRPYSRGSDVEANETYSAYRRRKFDQFLAEATRDLAEPLRRQWLERVYQAETRDLPAYLQQMSILAYLEPDENGETRTPFPLQKAHIGVIHQGRYYLIPACLPRSEQPAHIMEIRSQIATLMAYPANVRPAQLTELAEIKRAGQASLRKKMSQTLAQDLELLRLAPILINCDQRPAQAPLTEIRRAERGVGDHALTIFDTGKTLIFDQSHIFFDGAWGAALAEIMTNEALSWAVYLNTLPPEQPRQARPFVLTLKVEPPDQALVQKAPRITPEAGAETEVINLKAMLRLRRLFKQRNDLIQLTVNDLLILYRALHAATYEADPAIVAELKTLTNSGSTKAAAVAALEAINASRQTNPAIVIPVDASYRVPRDRLYPITFEVPLRDLNLLTLHEQAMASLTGYKNKSGDPSKLYTRFDKLQREYLTKLAAFGVVMSRAKEIAIIGESASVGAIKMLAHIPTPLQRMLETIPNRIDLLNDLIRGREVFSNVGAVAPTSTLSRFLTAKDDNEKKSLAWGVITDAGGAMRISLRDFRPHVGLLQKAGHRDLATRMVQDYLNSYANGLNQYIGELQAITESSRETQFVKLEKNHAKQ